MNTTISLLFWAMLLVSFFLPGNRCVSFAQSLEVDQEERFVSQTAGVDQVLKDVPTPPKTGAQAVKEIKYVAGNDGLWFTADDQVYHYFINTYDSSGRIIKKACLKGGTDELVDYQTFEYAPDGKIAAETSFDNKHVKQYTAVYEYDLKGRKIRMTRVNPKNEETRSIAYYYDKKGQLVKDVEYVNKEVEKYHRYEYDRKGLMTRAMEYHIKEQGTGADGKWFTSDDVVSSAKEFFYNKDGSKSMEKKYIKAGPDGKWFTRDDVLQYYTLFYY